MNIWDSVQRGLEKASHEAARIAKVQRLHTTINTLSRQIQAQQGNLIQITMELFSNGQLTQSELAAICQNLSFMQQQLAQAQAELKLTQSQGQAGVAGIPTAPTTQLGATGPYPPLTPNNTLPNYTGEGIAPTLYAPPTPPPPPNYQPYTENTVPIPAPPPPPSEELPHISTQETRLMHDDGHIAEENVRCTNCNTDITPGNAFCHNCGKPVKETASYLPTIRGTTGEPLPFEDRGTVRAPTGPLDQDMGTAHSQDTPSPQDGGN